MVKKELQSHIEAKGSVLEAVQLTAVHDFASWLWPLGLQLAGAFMSREGIEAPHSISFKLGSCLCADEHRLLEEPVVRGAVYCTVKNFMRDTQLQQPPVLCIMPGRSGRVTNGSPPDLVRARAMSSTEIKSCLTLATLVRKDMPAAYTALRALVYERTAVKVPLTWLETFTQPDVDSPPDTGNMHFRHLPKSSWKLVSQIAA